MFKLSHMQTSVAFIVIGVVFLLVTLLRAILTPHTLGFWSLILSLAAALYPIGLGVFRLIGRKGK